MSKAITLLTLWVGLLQLSVPAKDGEPSNDLERFFWDPLISMPEMSPDGRKLSYVRRFKGERSLLVYDLETQKQVAGTPASGSDVDAYWWVNQDTLIVSSVKWEIYVDGIYTVKSDLKRPKQIISNEQVYQMIDPAPLDPENMLGFLDPMETVYPDVFKFQIHTGRKKTYVENPGNISHWLTDRAGRIRLGYTPEGVAGGWIYRSDDDSDWEAYDFDRLYYPFFLNEKNFMMASDSRDGRSRLIMWDVDKRERVGKPIQDPVYDLEVENLMVDPSTNGVIGVTVYRDKPQNVWLEPTAKDLNKLLQTTFPGEFHSILGITHDQNRILFYSTSPTKPLTIGGINFSEKRLEIYGKAYPWLDESTLCPMEPIQFQNREDVTIYGYLTRSKKARGKAPLVTLIHGGPMVRDNWGFNPEVQYLANLGYHVLQINYRGSSGYGRAYSLSNSLEVCEVSVKDVIDGIQWAIATGEVDESRIVAMGSSYGGFLSMACAAEAPGLIQLVVANAGVYDWNAHWKWKKDQTEERFEWFRDFVGDYENNPGDYDRVSPVNRATKIDCPVLLIHGNNDAVVSASQSKYMYKALRNANKDVKLEILNWGRHGNWDQSLRLKVYTLITGFLEKHSP